MLYTDIIIIINRFFFQRTLSIFKQFSIEKSCTCKIRIFNTHDVKKKETDINFIIKVFP